MRKKVKYISLTLILLVIAAVLIIPKINTTGEIDGRNQGRDTQVQAINADGYILKQQTLENEVKAVGTIRANEEIEVRSELSRKVKGIFFKEGAHVSSGNVLFKLDSDDLEARLKKQEVEEKLAVLKLEREKQLIEKGLTSQQDYEESENKLEMIRADISMTKIEISKTDIRAPFSGMIGLRNVSKGSYITPALVMTTIQDISRVKIDFSVPEKYVQLLRKGQKIMFSVEGIEGVFEGEVYAYEPKIENNTRSLVLRAVSNNPGKKLMPGTFASVKLIFSADKEIIMVPTEAIIPKLKGHSLFVVRNGRAKLLDVEIGERNELVVQITSDNLQPGDTIITTNILRLRNDDPVRINKLD